MGTRKRPSKRAAEEAEREWEILFPVREVELQSGRKVIVRQWDIETGAVLTPQVVRMMQRMQEAGLSGEVEIAEIIAIAIRECKTIVAETIGWTEGELDQRASMDDFYDLLQAVFDTCLMREDGGGALKKIVALAAELVPLAGLQQPEPSTSTSEPDTP